MKICPELIPVCRRIDRTLSEDWEIYAFECFTRPEEKDWAYVEVKGAVPEGIWPNQTWTLQEKIFLLSREEAENPTQKQLNLFGDAQ